MVKTQSIIKVADNSGARFARCIRILNKVPKACGYVGDIIIVSVQRTTPNKKIKNGTVQRAVIVRTANNISRFDGSKLRFDTTAIVLLNKMSLPIGTRVFGPVSKELRNRKFLKIISLAIFSI